MFYLPESGAMWDPTVIWWKDAYYMLSMHLNGEGGKWDGMWLAKSPDGVHWTGVGRAIEDADGVCKMFIHETPDGLVVNFGSFSHLTGTDNDTLKFYCSTDMEHWDYMYKNNPDARWYNTGGRWDHMYVMKDTDNRYYGYVVATPKTGLDRAWGLLESDNGRDFTVMEPPAVEWGDIPAIDCLEGGGCERIGDKYYYIGGFVGYARSYGYGLYTFVSDNPRGPFVPDKEAFRFCGFDRLPDRVFIQNLAAFCRGRDGELLVSNAVDAGGTFKIGLLPLRKAVVDEEGHLRLGYWEGNEKAKGEQIPLSADNFKAVYTDGSLDAPPPEHWTSPEFWAKNGGAVSLHMRTDAPDGPTVSDRNMVVKLDVPFDLDKGVILEGRLKASIFPVYDETAHRTHCWRPSIVGIALGEGDEKSYLAVTLEVGHPYKRSSYIESITLDGRVDRRIIDTTGQDCATVRGIDQNRDYEFKLLYRSNTFELYVGGLLVQTFVHLRPQTGVIAFTVQNACLDVEEIKLFHMSL